MFTMIGSSLTSVFFSAENLSNQAPKGTGGILAPKRRRIYIITSRSAGFFDKSGAVAQLGERVNGIHEVEGSIPFSSTRFHPRNSIHPYPVDIQSRVALNGSFSNLYASKSILLKTIL